MGMGDKISGWTGGIVIVNTIFLYLIVKYKLPQWLMYIPLTVIGLFMVAFVLFMLMVAIFLG